MSRKTAKRRNPIAREVRSPKYRPRVIGSKKVYDRKRRPAIMNTIPQIPPSERRAVAAVSSNRALAMPAERMVLTLRT